MGKRLALAVGISQYGEGFEELPGSLRDVQAMAEVLKNPDRGAFETQVLENCDRSTLATQIEQFFRGKSPDDVLLFYFSGHGDLGSGGISNQHLHFCTSNSTKINNLLTEASAVSADFLNRQMTGPRKPNRIIVILDCCYSGAIGDLLKKGDEEINYDELNAKGRVILASSSAAKVSLQAKDGLSLYTRYLIEGMEGAAYPGEGDWIVARSLHDYADRRFEIENKGYPPKIIADDTGYNLPIVRSPKPDLQLEYRQVVDRIFQELDQRQGLDFNGEIADKPLILKRLEIAQRKGSIDPDFAAKVLEEVQIPYRSRAIKRQEYADAFRLATQNGTLPDEYDRQLLTEIRQDLGLGETEADRIEQKLALELNLNPFLPLGKGELEGVKDLPLLIPAQEEEPVNTILQWDVDSVPLKSEKRVNFEKLRDLLKAQKWKEADQETYRLMVTIVGREEGDWIREKELRNFPCKDLKTIDRLWVQASQGHYGFSVQKEIYMRCDDKLGDDYPGHEIWEKFATEVGWRVNNQWENYDNLSWNSIYVPGYLPISIWIRSVYWYHVGEVGVGGWVAFFSLVLSHRDL